MLKSTNIQRALLLKSPLLNKQQREPTLISINTVASVSYCSRVMLYFVVFKFLSIVYFVKYASQYITQNNLFCGRSRYNYRLFFWRGEA